MAEAEKPKSIRTADELLRRLERSVLVCDGAMGTLLYQRGIFINRCYDELNLSAPDLVLDIHRQYAAAQADIIETNTFGANRYKLKAHGLEAEVERINQAGVR
nr:homocysteine S-methyltransferase family protein [bacterium]